MRYVGIEELTDLAPILRFETFRYEPGANPVMLNINKKHRVTHLLEGELNLVHNGKFYGQHKTE